MSPADLPVEPFLPSILEALETRGTAVVCAPPGSGKTTRIPPAIVDHVPTGAVWVLQPRRLAARSVARHIARERGETLGRGVGYQVRFDNRSSAATRLLVMTEGILTRRLRRDPFLDGVAAVVLDEFHERSLDTDLALALLRTVREEARPDLLIVVMSATFDPQPVADFLDGAPVFSVPSRTHPLEVDWLESGDRRPIDAVAADAVRREFVASEGDLLVFLPGKAEIRRCEEQLASWAKRTGAEVLPLHGALAPEEQERALKALPRRKVVLATNVAETSVTIEGIRCVIDSGLVRRLHHDPRRGIDRLELQTVSRASADQRAGRAGRTGPGRALRLWTRPSHRERPADEIPEIRRLDLSGALLELLGFGAGDPARFRWFEPPETADIQRAVSLLRRLGALPRRGWSPTSVGRELLTLPLPPRLGRLVQRARELGVGVAGARLAALLSERDPLRLDFRDDRWPTGPSDLLLRLDLLDGRGPLPPEADRGALARIRRAAEQIEGRREKSRETAAVAVDIDEALGRALLAAYPDRLARRSEPGSPRARLVGGSSVRLAPSSVVREAELFLAIDCGARGGRGVELEVRLASAVDRAWLDQEFEIGVEEKTEVHFDEARRKVIARRTEHFGDLVLSTREAGLPDAVAAAQVLEEAVRAHPESLPRLSPADEAVLLRLRWLAEALPELALPSFDDEALLEARAACCAGRRSFAELEKAPVLAVLLGRLTHEQRQALETEAPESLTLASGARGRLEYEPGRPPVLRARVQQLFGTLETPRLARGRVPCLVEILAPNHRPVQRTQDLANFWRETYARVRKDLRGRYPKHAWPEKPPTG